MDGALYMKVMDALKDESGFSAQELSDISNTLMKGSDDKDLKRNLATDSAMAYDRARNNPVAEMQAIRRAEDAVRPVIGEVGMAFDSAAGVYGAALKQMGVQTAGVHPSAFERLFETARQRPNRGGSAVRGGSKGSFEQMFPDAPPVRAA